ncbi:PQQ-dependent sugar dehydrogenase [Petrimonas sp.]|uniref:PQQ-dependent sugar dehydrogenase n=1 Tax=Petrimonas sp. TaxID=2023866 RepID=UPI003F51A520
MKNKNLYLLLGLALVIVQVVHSCKNMPRAAQARDAATNYRMFCAGCHGDNLEKFAAKQWMEEAGTASVERSIKDGILDIGMPAFAKTFSDKEIKELAIYVKQGIPADRTLLKPAVTADGMVKSEEYNLVIDTVVTGLEVPWGLAFLPNGDLLISERKGTLHTFSNGKLSAPIQGLPPIMAFGQGGLMDIALHPDYDKNGWIYFTYSALDTKSDRRMGNTNVMRARLQGNRLTDVQVLFEGTPVTDRGHHFGSKLAFDGKGHLYFGIGDRGQHFDFPQKLDNSNGKIHRINDDGTIPTDNPFYNTPGAIKSIYSYGHRNPQGTVVHPVTGDVWETEHGPMGGDELNLIKPGLNYGWPVISYGINYDGTILTELTEKEGMEQPVLQWTPSIAACGMTFVTGDRFKKWENNILVGSLRFDYVERVVLNGHKIARTEKLVEGIGRVRNVVMSPDGLVYIGLEEPGMIVRLVPVE